MTNETNETISPTTSPSLQGLEEMADIIGADLIECETPNGAHWTTDQTLARELGWMPTGRRVPFASAETPTPSPSLREAISAITTRRDDLARQRQALIAESDEPEAPGLQAEAVAIEIAGIDWALNALAGVAGAATPEPGSEPLDDDVAELAMATFIPGQIVVIHDDIAGSSDRQAIRHLYLLERALSKKRHRLASTTEAPA